MNNRNYYRAMICSLFLLVAMIVTLMCSACAFSMPTGVKVDGYDKKIDYSTLMLKCAKDGSDSAIKMGTIYEEQRNLKIKTEGMKYGTTDIFATSKTVDKLRERLDDYMNKSKANPTPDPNKIDESKLKWYFTEDDAVLIAKTLLNECGGVKSKVEQACVAWTILNRVDCMYDGCGTVRDVVTAPKQFAYWSSTSVRQDLYDLAYDVLYRWNLEKNGYTDVGRVLPSNYLFFHGENGHNWFKIYEKSGSYWYYSLPSPY